MHYTSTLKEKNSELKLRTFFLHMRDSNYTLNKPYLHTKIDQIVHTHTQNHSNKY